MRVGVDDDSIQRSITDFGYPAQGALVGTASLMVLGVYHEYFELVSARRRLLCACAW